MFFPSDFWFDGIGSVAVVFRRTFTGTFGLSKTINRNVPNSDTRRVRWFGRSSFGALSLRCGIGFASCRSRCFGFGTKRGYGLIWLLTFSGSLRGASSFRFSWCGTFCWALPVGFGTGDYKSFGSWVLWWTGIARRIKLTDGFVGARVARLNGRSRTYVRGVVGVVVGSA